MQEVPEITDRSSGVPVETTPSDSVIEFIVRKHVHFIRSTCRRVLWAYPHLTDDAVQCVLIVAARKISFLPGDDSRLIGWLHRCSLNVCRNMSRAETLRLASVKKLTEADATDGCALRDEESDILKTLDEVIADLPDRQRRAVLRHYIDGADCATVGKEMVCSESAVNMLLNRARTAMRKSLSRRGLSVSLAALTATLESQAEELLTVGAFEQTGSQQEVWQSVESSESVRATADLVVPEMDRAAAKEMWGWIGVGAAGLATIGVGTALVVSHLQSVSMAPTWRIESVSGAAMVRRGDATLAVKTGDALCSGDTIVTATNQEVAVLSEGGDRILLREDSELRVQNSQVGTVEEGRVWAFSPRRSVADLTPYLTRGAVVAQMKQMKGPAYFTTPHAEIDVDSADFFLMVANGLTSNNVPWSFSRLDVTEGHTRFRNAETQLSSFEFSVSSHQFAAVGMDHEGKTIVTAARKSDGREMSPKYGGVFFRDRLKDARWESWFGVFQPKTPPLYERQFTPEVMMASITKSENATACVDQGALLLVGDGKDPMRVSVSSGLEEPDCVRFSARLSLVHVRGNSPLLEFYSIPVLFTPVSPPPILASSQERMGPVNTGDLDVGQINRLVGRACDGNPIYANAAWILRPGQKPSLVRQDLRCGPLRVCEFAVQDLDVRIRELRVEAYADR